MEDEKEKLEKISLSFDKINNDMFFMKEEFSEVRLENRISIEFENFYTAIAKNGGFMAFCKKPKVLIMDKSNLINKYVLIMCQDGSNCIKIPYQYNEKESELILFDFSYEEKLYGIHNNGKIIKFDLLKETAEEKISGDRFKIEKIISAKLFEKGYVAFTEQSAFYITKDIKNPQPSFFISLLMLSIKNLVTDYIFIPQSKSSSKNTELIFPHPDKDGIIHVIGKNENENFSMNVKGEFIGINYIKKDIIEGFKIENENNKNEEEEMKDPNDLNKISALAISPSNTQIAMYRNDGTVFLFHSSFNMEKFPRLKCRFFINENPIDEYEQNEEKDIIEFNRETMQFLFCGEDAICLCGKRFILLINVANKTLYYKITNRSGESVLLNMNFMFCISEIDGLRILTHDNVYFISKVSKELFQCCFPFSDAPTKKLINAYNLKREKNPEWRVVIKKIYNRLSDTSNQLLNVASQLFWTNNNHFNKNIQLFVLKSAHFGISMLSKEKYGYNKFIDMCQDIRILNNLRSPNSYLDKPRFITYKEFKSIEMKTFIKLLIKQQNFSYAYDISNYLKLNLKKVFQTFALAKIKKYGEELLKNEQITLYNDIIKTLSIFPNISYIKLAKKSFKYNAKDIGVKFLENEKSILIKIPQYIQLKEWDKALSLANETCDRNISLTVIDKIFKDSNIKAEEFIKIICKFENCKSIIIDYLSKNIPSLLDKYLCEKGFFEDLIFINIEKFFKCKNLETRKTIFGKIKDYLKSIEKKPGVFDIKFYRNYIKNLEDSINFKINCVNQTTSQKELIPITNKQPFDNSIYDCFKEIISQGEYNFIKDEAANFDFSKNKLILLRLRTYVEMDQFNAIDNVINNSSLKKLNLTPLNLAELYFDYKKYDKAVEYIKLINEPDYFEYKIDMLKYMNKYEDALFCIISDKKCDRKDDLVKEILNKKPELKKKADELFEKYKH